MKTIFGFILTPFFHLYFAMVLLILHPFQVLAHKIFGDNARRKVVNVLIFFLVRGLHLMGSRIKFSGLDKIPTDRPIIVVSNHQSLYDIPALSMAFTKHYPKFISKIELGKGIPSVSYNLVHAQSALIDRSKGGQSVKEIFKLGRLIEGTDYAACIFPEGTRSRNGKLKSFMPAGVNTLLRAAPSAVIVPFVIDGHSELINNGKFPFKAGVKITYKVLDPIDPKGMEINDLVGQLELSIKTELGQI